MSRTAYERLLALGLELPPVPPPRGAFKPFSRSGSLVFLAGQICEVERRGPLRRADRRSTRPCCRPESRRALRAESVGGAKACTRW